MLNAQVLGHDFEPHLAGSHLCQSGLGIFYFSLGLSLVEKNVCWGQTWDQMVLLLHTRSMTFDKLLSPLEPQFPHLSNGVDNICSLELL